MFSVNVFCLFFFCLFVLLGWENLSKLPIIVGQVTAKYHTTLTHNIILFIRKSYGQVLWQNSLLVAGVVGLGVVVSLLHASALRCKYTRVHTERQVKERTKMCHRHQLHSRLSLSLVST